MDYILYTYVLNIYFIRRNTEQTQLFPSKDLNG